MTSSWSGEIVAFVQGDFMGRREESHLYAYLMERHEANPRVALKRAWAEALAGDGGGLDAFARTLAGLLYEQATLHKAPAARALTGTAVMADEKPSRANSRIRRRLKAIGEQGRAALPDGDPSALLRAAADEMLAGKIAANACVCALECACDARCGAQALGTEGQRAELLARVHKACGRLGLKWAEGGGEAGPGSAGGHAGPDAAFFERVAAACVLDEAAQWLLNKGSSVGTGEGAGLRRVQDIPIGLVERCLSANGALCAKLGIAAAPAPSAAREAGGPSLLGRARDLRNLYISLARGGYEVSIVPVELDPATGLGLYVIGPGLAARELVGDALLWKLFKGGEPRRHFFAIMSCYELVDPGHLVEAAGAGDAAVVQGLWSNAVKAWVPELGGKHDFALRALAEFKAAHRSVEGYLAYQDVNGDAPDECPDRYRGFFASDDGF